MLHTVCNATKCVLLKIEHRPSQCSTRFNLLCHQPVPMPQLLLARNHCFRNQSRTFYIRRLNNLCTTFLESHHWCVLQAQRAMIQKYETSLEDMLVLTFVHNWLGPLSFKIQHQPYQCRSQFNVCWHQPDLSSTPAYWIARFRTHI